MNARHEATFEKYLQHGLSAEETRELHRLLSEDPGAHRAFADFLREWSLLADVSSQMLVHQSGCERRPRSARQLPARWKSLPVDGAGWRRAQAVSLGRRDRPEFRMRWAPALAAGLLVAAGLLFGARWQKIRDRLSGAPAAEPCAVVSGVAGKVYVADARGRQRVEVGRRLATNDRLLTGPEGSRAVMSLGDWARLELEKDTEIALLPQTRVADDTTARPDVLLARGILCAAITPGREQGMLFLTRQAEVRVVGTRFRIAAEPDRCHVEVVQGRLQLRNRRSGEVTLLDGGQHAVVAERTVVTAGASAQEPSPAKPAISPDELLALYTFRESAGAVVHDVSEAGLPLNLHVQDTTAVRRLPGGGLAILRPTLIASADPATKIADACRAGNEFAVEVWLRPVTTDALVVDEAVLVRRIVVLSEDNWSQDFMLGIGSLAGRNKPAYMVRLRTTESSPNGFPATCSAAGMVSGDGLTHLVFTRNRAGETRLYVNGVDRTGGMCGQDGRVSDRPGLGALSNWDRGFRLGLGNEFTRDRPWLGELHRLAIYSRALRKDEVRRNFEAGRPDRNATNLQAARMGGDRE